MTFAPRVVNSSNSKGRKVPRSSQCSLSFTTWTPHAHLSQQMIHQFNKHKGGLVNHRKKCPICFLSIYQVYKEFKVH